MKRCYYRHPLAAFLLTTLVLPVSGVRAASAEAPRPNILLIMVDDMGFSDLGCYGGEIHTPHVDALAAGGLQFVQFYNTSRCCPTRASLMTGLYPHQAGVGHMNGDAGPKFPGYRGHLSDRAMTIAEVLGGAGYQTYMVGKWHLTDQTNPVKRGFSEFYGLIRGSSNFFREHPNYVRLPAGRPRREYPADDFYSSDAFADYAVDFIEQAHGNAEKPWFLYLAFNAPHFPLQAPEEEVAKYKDRYTKGWDRLREERFARQQEMGLMPDDATLSPRGFIPAEPYNEATGWANKVNPAWDSLPSDRRADLSRRMAVFAGMVDRMDQAVGRVVKELRDTNQFDNTLIFFLSDNGACAEWDPWGFDKRSGPNNVLHREDELDQIGTADSYISYGSGWANASNTPWRLYKHYEHEGGIHTPLVVHWPGGIQDRGARRSQPGHIIDIMATCIDVSGATFPKQHNELETLPPEGQSLVPAFADRPLKREYIAWEHEGNRAIRVDDWKLVSLKGHPWELYNLKADLLESNDLAADEPQRVEALSAQWNEWAKRCHVLPQPAAVTAPPGKPRKAK